MPIVSDSIGRCRRFLWLLQERLWLSRSPSPDGLRERIPVFLLFTGRSGSKLLLDYFGCIPGTSYEYEILDPDFGRRRAIRWVLGDERMRFSRKDAALAYVAWRLCRQQGRLCAVKISDWHLERAGLLPIDLATAFPAARFIILYRQSLGRQVVSHVVAKQTRQWGWRIGDERYRPFTGTVHLDPDWIEDHFRKIRAFYTGLLECDAIRNRAALVCYERMVEDPRKAFEQAVFPLLGQTAADLRTRYRKQATRPLSELVANFTEVEHLLLGPDSFQDYALQ